jgi:hypothetical protein
MSGNEAVHDGLLPIWIVIVLIPSFAAKIKANITKSAKKRP